WEELVVLRTDGRFNVDRLGRALMERLPPRIDALPIMPGVEDILDAADQLGLSIGLATGQDRHRLDQHLDRLGLASRFHTVVTAAEVERGKPAPDIFIEAAHRLGVDPAECVVLEDSVPGCEAATAAGMRVVACPSRVSVHCTYPSSAHRVASLPEVLTSPWWPGSPMDRG